MSGRQTALSARIARIAIAAIALLGPLATARADAGSPLIRIPPAQLSAPKPAGKFAAAPRAVLPTDIDVLYDEDGTGLVMRGALKDKAASAVGVLRAIFLYSGAFDPNPSLGLVVADDDDRQAQALFVATTGGEPTTGIAIVALNDSGGDATVFYDSTDAFDASFPRLRAALAGADDPATDGGGPTDDCPAPRKDTASAWQPLIAAISVAEPPEPAAEDAPAQPLLNRLARDTGTSWRAVPLTELK